jgi:predicted dienelactone hydrolase
MIRTVLLVLVALWSGGARAGERTFTLAGLAVTVWEPPATAAPSPIVVFSHGLHGCATQSRFPMEAFARAGYIVFAPNHRDATCHGGTGSWFQRPEAAFGQPATWTDATYRDRADDVRLLIAALHADAAWQGRIDWSRLALAGHSLGGYTVLGLAGAWPAWRLPGVRAVLAWSPYTEPFLPAGRLRGLSAPVMYQGGTLDVGITPWIDKIGGAYDQSPAPKYDVTLAGATHFAWTDLGLRDRDAIVTYSLAFLDHALNGAATPVLYRKGEGVADLRFSER